MTYCDIIMSIKYNYVIRGNIKSLKSVQGSRNAQVYRWLTLSLRASMTVTDSLCKFSLYSSDTRSSPRSEIDSCASCNPRRMSFLTGSSKHFILFKTDVKRMKYCRENTLRKEADWKTSV